MASPWNYTMQLRPASGQWCIIRVIGYYGEPVRARYQTAGTVQGWLLDDTFAKKIPFYMVPRWKPE